MRQTRKDEAAMQVIIRTLSSSMTIGKPIMLVREDNWAMEMEKNVL